MFYSLELQINLIITNFVFIWERSSVNYDMWAHPCRYKHAHVWIEAIFCKYFANWCCWSHINLLCLWSSLVWNNLATKYVFSVCKGPIESEKIYCSKILAKIGQETRMAFFDNCHIYWKALSGLRVIVNQGNIWLNGEFSSW